MENGDIGDVVTSSSQEVSAAATPSGERLETTEVEESALQPAAVITDVESANCKLPSSVTTDGEQSLVDDGKENTPGSVDQQLSDQITDSLVNGGTESHNENEITADGDVSQQPVNDVEKGDEAEEFHVDKRQETEQINRKEEVVEREDGSEEFRLQESKKLTLEEVTSKEIERPATEAEVLALQQQQQQSAAASDDVVEIPIEKNVLVEEFKRIESVHEDKVAGEPVQSTQTVTEEHVTEKIQETPVSVTSLSNESEQQPTDNVESAAVLVEGSQKEEPAMSEEAALTETKTEESVDASTNETTVAESVVTSPSTDEITGKEKGSKSKGLIGFFKARARSQSRERDEHGFKEDQKTKRDQQSDEQKKSGTLERDKKFKLNLFGKKGEDEKGEGTEDVKQGTESDKEAVKPKSLKKTLFGKKNKEKSVDDGEKDAASDEHPSDEGEAKSKDRKWFRFGKKPGKEVSPVVADEARIEKEVDNGQEIEKFVGDAETGESKQEETAENADGSVTNNALAAATGEDGEISTAVSIDGQKIEQELAGNTNTEPEDVNTQGDLDTEVAASVVETVHQVPDVEDIEGNGEKVNVEVKPEEDIDAAQVKEVSPDSTLMKQTDTEHKDQNNEQGGKGTKKFSFGFKFGKKQKSLNVGNTADEQQPNDGEQTAPGTEHQQTVEQAAVETSQGAENVHEPKQSSEDVKTKQSKIKLFHFGKKSKSKQKEEDEKEPNEIEGEQQETKVDGSAADAEQKEEKSEGVEADVAQNDSEKVAVEVSADDHHADGAEADVQVEAAESSNHLVTEAVVEGTFEAEAEVSTTDNKADETVELEVKDEPKEQKKSIFGIKFGLKHETKDGDTQGDEELKAKDGKWSPFSKKPGKKATSDSGKVDGDGNKVESEQKPAEQETKEDENLTVDVSTKEDASEAVEAVDSSKAHESKDKSLHVRIPKLFSFGKKEKAAEEKPADTEIKTEEASEQPPQPKCDDDASHPKDDEQQVDEKKQDESEGEKKEESKLTTGFRKLFTIGKKNKDSCDKEDANVEEVTAEVSSDSKHKQRDKSPHRKFPFEIKFGKKKDKEDVESPTKDSTSTKKVEEPAVAASGEGEPDVTDDGLTVDAEVHEVAEAVQDQPPEVVADKPDEVENPVVEESTQNVESAAGDNTIDEPLAAPTDVSVSESAAVEEKPANDDTPIETTKEDIVAAEAAAPSEAAPVSSEAVEVEPEIQQQDATVDADAHAQSVEVQSDAAAVATDDAEKQEEQPTQGHEQRNEVPAQETAAEVSTPGKDHKSRRRFPFGLKFGKRTERAKSAERATSSKATQQTTGDGEETAKVAKTVEASASFPDVRLQAAAEGANQPVDETTTGENEKTTSRTDTPTKTGAKHELPHINIKWPHFGKKKQEETADSSAATAVATGDAKLNGVSDESQAEKDATPKKQSQQTPTNASLTDTQKKSSLGKGIFKLFSPRRHGDLQKSASCSAGDEKEPFVSYSVEGGGHIVAETQWRNRTLLTASDATDSKTTARLSKSPTTIDQRDQEPLVDVVADVIERRNEPGQVTVSGGHFVVVAIDFGTTYSGYAFSFARDARTAAGQAGGIHMMRRWEGGDPGVVNQKTPTTILLTPNEEFHSFGFTARDFYHDLDSTEASKWLYFEKFKMDLHHSVDLNSETTIRSSNGHEFPALKLFAMALRYFKEHALKELSSQSATIIVNEDVRWVITVPAIWKAPAKQFMRQAAYEAGIASPDTPDSLLIALEPEAASIYIRQLRLSQLVPERSHVISRTLSSQKPTTNGVEVNGDESTVSKDDEKTDHDHVLADEFHAGTRYMVVDCGGGTVDITVHEMENESGNLKELFKATGGPYGSTGVDREFEKLLNDIFGNDFIESFKAKRPAGWVDLMIAFESRKRATHPHKTNALNISLPFSFIDYHKKYFGTQVESAIKKYCDKDIHWSMQGMLRLMPDAMKRLFHNTLESIKNAVSQVLSNPEASGVEYLFLVGGFAESPILQFEMRKEFDHLLKIIIPQEVSLTILKGAVCFGLDPTVITVRKSRMTYGVGVLNRFIRGVHPESKLVRRGGNEQQPESEWCRDVFDQFVVADQSVGLGDTVLRRYAPAEYGQSNIVIHIYSSETSDVRFVTDDGVQRCGTLRLELPTATDSDMADDRGRRREIQTRMTFGETEIKVWALDVASGRSVRAAIDFLNK